MTSLLHRYIQALHDSPAMRRDLILRGPRMALRMEVAREETIHDLHLCGFTQEMARSLIETFERHTKQRYRTPASVHRFAHLAAEGRFDPPDFFNPEDYPS